MEKYMSFIGTVEVIDSIQTYLNAKIARRVNDTAHEYDDYQRCWMDAEYFVLENIGETLGGWSKIAHKDSLTVYRVDAPSGWSILWSDCCNWSEFAVVRFVRVLSPAMVAPGCAIEVG